MAENWALKQGGALRGTFSLAYGMKMALRGSFFDRHLEGQRALLSSTHGYPLVAILYHLGVLLLVDAEGK